MRKKKNILLKILDKIFTLLWKNPDKYLKGVNGVIHIGANTGQERILYDKYDLNVLWIEPIPEVYEILVKNIEKYKKQKAVMALVTDQNDKEYKFNIANNNGASSSILKLEKHIDLWPDVFYNKSMLMNSITLEKLLETKGIDISNYQALIIDTQGSELLVLKGSVSLLKNFKFIATEVADFESYKDCCTLLDMSKFMTENNFEESHRTKFAEGTNGGSYYDVLFKKKV